MIIEDWEVGIFNIQYSIVNRHSTMMDYINRLKVFLNEVKIEMKKVSWPTRKETIYTTSAVIISVFLISFFLGLVDLGLSKLIERLIK